MPRNIKTSHGSAAPSAFALEGSDYPGSGQTEISLFFPRRYEKNYDYPLVVWLHGGGDNQQQIIQVMPHISGQNYVAVGVQGTSLDMESGHGFCWVESEQDADEAVRRVFEAIEIATCRASINYERIFIGGYQCGGSMALRVAMQYPETFAGAFSINGGVPRTGQPLSKLEQLRDLPLFISFGETAQQYSSTDACQDLKLAHAAHLSVMFRQYACGDELRTPVLSDINHWLMERITGQPMPENVPEPAEAPDSWN
jgi:phospholipase/carboxylesterase